MDRYEHSAGREQRVLRSAHLSGGPPREATLLRGLIHAVVSEWSRSSRESSPRAADNRSEFTIKVRRDHSTGLLTVDLPDENPPIATRLDDFDIRFDIEGTRIEMTVSHP